MGFINYLIGGVSLGSVYAITALEYIMVYGTARALNFTRGDVIMTGSYVVFVMISTMGFPPVVGVLVAALACTLPGMIIERVVYKSLRDVSPLAVLITAIGVSYLLQNVALLMSGAGTKPFTSVVAIPVIKLVSGWITITGEIIATTSSYIVIMIGLTTFTNKSKAGQAILAASENHGAATLMGINTSGTIALTFAIGSALAAATGVPLCSVYPSLTPYTGSMPDIKALVAVMLGGIGFIPGAFIGGILLGVIEILAKAYISSQMPDAIVFLVLIIVLLAKPTGILGRKINEKVWMSV